MQRECPSEYMGFLDLVLNIFAVWLWASWLMRVKTQNAGYRYGSVSNALNHPSKKQNRVGRHSGNWKMWVALLILLIARPLLYWDMGLGWNAVLKFGAVSISFATTNLLAMQIFSLASFIQMLLIFYSWLLLLGIFNYGNNLNENNLAHKVIHCLVGRLGNWPVGIRLCLPAMVAMPLWFFFSLILEWTGIFPQQGSIKAIFHESLVMGLCAYLPWCHLLAGLIFIYFLNSYLFLGTSPVWNYLHAITRKLLAFLYMLPLTFGKIDFVPIVGLGITFLIYEYGCRWLSALFTMAMS